MRDGTEILVNRVIVNVTFSYAIIFRAATMAKESDEWKDDVAIQKLDFSAHWISDFLERAQMRRRKITRDDKEIPGEMQVRAQMKIGQDLYLSEGHEYWTSFNMDETAFTYAIGPTHMFCPIDQERAINMGIPNTKLRISAVITVSGEGKFAPLMMIIKHSVSSFARPDQSNMKVIRQMHKENKGFGEADGWALNLWSKELTIVTKGVSTTAMHKCWYIIHKETGHVITSQWKAWNDTVRMVMWLELIIEPMKLRLGKMLLWMDNCGSHKTSAVQLVIDALGLDMAYYPPNMTAILQVLDLVVNGPLKGHIKNLRASRIFDEFHRYKELLRLEELKAPSDRRKIDFVVPEPKMLQSIQDLINLYAINFKEEDFMQGIVKSFQKTGSIPTINFQTGEKEFAIYKAEHCNGIRSGPPSKFTVTGGEQYSEEDISECLDCFLEGFDESQDIDDIAEAFEALDDDV
jgi:hypothetical protein